MLKFLKMVFKNLGRNKWRTILTGLAVVVLVAIYAVMTTVTGSVRRLVSSQARQTKLVVSERWVMPSRLPIRYLPEITGLAEVEDWTTWNFYAGFFDDSLRRDRQGVGIATRPDNLLAMHPDLSDIGTPAVRALQKTKSGVLIGAAVLETMRWKVGQNFTFVSTSHPGRNLQFTIVGVIPRGPWARGFLFRQDYFEEGVGNDATINCVWLRVRDPNAGRALAAGLQQRFSDRQPQLKVETESAGAARFVGRSQALLSIIDVVVAILLVDMVVILTNSISIVTRERRTEMAVLKVLGFQPWHVMNLVIFEAVLVGAFSGFLGAGTVWLVSELTVKGVLRVASLTSFLVTFPVSLQTLLTGTLLGAGVGLAGSIIPAWNCRRVQVADVFANVT